MPLKKLALKPGINKERTRYTNETGWYECDKIRFRQGYPEKIGGWKRISANTFLGVCRSLWSWVTLGNTNFVGVGTHLKFYLELGGVYNDITPIRATTTTAASFAASNGSATVTVTDSSHGAVVGDFVTFSGAASLGGNITAAVLNAEYQIQSVPSTNTYTITATATDNASDTGNGGGSVTDAYQLNTGDSIAVLINKLRLVLLTTCLGVVELGVLVLGALVVQLTPLFVCGVRLILVKTLFSVLVVEVYFIGMQPMARLHGESIYLH